MSVTLLHVNTVRPLVQFSFDSLLLFIYCFNSLLKLPSVDLIVSQNILFGIVSRSSERR